MHFPTVLLALFSAASVHTADILAVFPFPAKSHHAVFQPIIQGLAKNGHKVTYVTPHLLSKPHPNVKQVELDNVMGKIKAMMEEEHPGFLGGAVKFVKDSWCNVLLRMAGEMTVEATLQNPKLQEIIKDRKSRFDLVLLETTFAQEPLIGLSHRYGASVVEVMPTSNIHWSYYMHGNPYDTNYIVDIDLSYTDHMSFKERLLNTIVSLTDRFINTYYFAARGQALMDQYMRYPGWETRPPMLDMVKNTSLFLMNTHVAVNYPYPMSPNFKEIGGINLQTKPNPLPKDVQEFMDSAKDGVIYFTLGSHIDVSEKLGDSLKAEFLKAFAKIKQRVLWKWETEFPNVPANVKISKWFPQQDILAHKNMKLFISHGGLLSITESVSNGIPLIGIPILGDQPKNVNQVAFYGYGLYLDFNNLTETSISWAINEILSNSRYSEAVKERSAIFKDKRETPLETAMYWIEYVLKHNGAHHLTPSVTTMPWCQQALIDVYLTMAALVIVPLVAVYFLLRALIRCICCRKSAKKETPKKKKKE